jgi:hypothetical protein
MAVTLKYAVFWDVTPRGSCKNRCFGRMYYIHNQVYSVFFRSVLRLLVTANVVPSSPILVTLIMSYALSIYV